MFNLIFFLFILVSVISLVQEYFCIDSRLVEVCRPACDRRCKKGRTGEFTRAPGFGFCASQKVYYDGYKLHALCGLSGVIYSYDLSKACVHDINYLWDIRLVYHDCNIIGDKGYLSADIQLDLFETGHIRQECPYRKKQKDRKTMLVPFPKAGKRIETVFSQLTEQFMIMRNYVKEMNGLFARIIGKISAQTFLQYINYVYGKPIGKIKYGLD